MWIAERMTSSTRQCAPVVTAAPETPGYHSDVDIGILEDADARIADFRKALASIHPDLRITTHDNAPAFIAWMRGAVPSVRLLSLDGDLFLCGSCPDPGTGVDVAEFLATQSPVCPVILHTANAGKADAMAAALARAQWEVVRADPLELNWLTLQWLPAARRALRA